MSTCGFCHHNLKTLRYPGVSFALDKCTACGLIYHGGRGTLSKEPVEGFTTYFFDTFGHHPLMFQTECDRLCKYLGRESLADVTLVDVGCGQGQFIKYAASQGARVMGVEANEKLRNELRLKGVSVYPSLEEMLAARPPGIDVIYCSHTLEHFLNPFHALKQMNQLLRPKGVISITVPCLNFSTLFFERLFHFSGLKLGWGLFYNEHLTYFNRKTLQQVVAASGFESFQILPGVLGENLLRKILRNESVVQKTYQYILLPTLTTLSWMGFTPNLSILGTRGLQFSNNLLTKVSKKLL